MECSVKCECLKTYTPIFTRIPVTIKNPNYYKQALLEFKNRKIMTTIVQVDIKVNGQERTYYDVSADELKGNGITKIDYGGLFAHKHEAEDQYNLMNAQIILDAEH